METGYQRGRIRDESMLYEHKKPDGSLPIIGVNTFRNPNGGAAAGPIESARGTAPRRRNSPCSTAIAWQRSGNGTATPPTNKCGASRMRR